MPGPRSIPPAKLRVFVINLDRDTARMAAIGENVALMGVPVERWPATDGDAVDTAVDQPSDVDIRGFGPWAGGEAGCGASHIRLWRYLVDERIPWAIVLEDDARLGAPIPADVGDWDLPVDADIVLLNDRSLAGGVRHRGRRYSYADVRGGAGTDGYLLSLAGARKLLAVTRPLLNPLDFQMYAHFASVRADDTFPFFWKLPGNPEASHVELTAYRIVPELITHAGVDSTIGNRRHPRARFYCRTLLGLNFDSATYYGAGYQTIPPAPAVQERPTDGPAPFLNGVDFSHCHTDEVRSTAAVLADHGVDTVRVSVWVGDGQAMSLAPALCRAKAAVEHGMRVYVALHYSDTWADPGRQRKPAAWRQHGIGQLIDDVHTYTANVVERFYQEDIPLAVVQTGNEITNGLLWADDGADERSGGRLHAPTSDLNTWRIDDQWIIIAELLKAADAGIAAGLPTGATVRTLLHLDRGADIDGALWWLDRSTQVGITSDLIGLSFYSMWHSDATIANLARIRELGVRHPHRGVVVSETAYPYRPFDDDNAMDPAAAEFPLTPDGQRRYLEAALATVRGARNGAGLIWWGACFTDGRVEPYVDKFPAHALFGPDGRPLPALRAFR
jgi:arabinogalactan endo-1,4-beta-galactosidase